VRTEALLSPDVGIVNRLDDGVTPWDHPRLATAFAQICDTHPITESSCNALPAGMAVDVPGARNAALGEAIERYSAAIVPTSRLTYADAASVAAAHPCAHPEWLRRSIPHPPVAWVSGWRMRPGVHAESAQLAASRVYLSDLDAEAGIAVTTSTGLACHPDAWTALRSGLLEVIERDAVMTTWLSRGPVHPVSSPLSWRTREQLPVRFDLAIEEYRLFLLPSATGIPVVLGVAIGAANQPPVAVGAAAALDLAQACRKALIETHQTLRWAAHMRAQQRAIPRESAELKDLEDHVAFYLDPGRISAFDFLLRTTQPDVSTDLTVPSGDQDAASDVDVIVRRCVDAGYDVFCADVTSADVRCAGRWVIRAVIPEMYPLLVGTQLLDEHPRLARERAINPDPHPFP
jgi:ribosomal protein S12 methylthiotransferase accessory factor